MNVIILDREYPLEYTVEAQTKMAERYGGIENMDIAFTGKDAAGMMEEITFLLAVMMEAGENRERVVCDILNKEYVGNKALTQKQLETILRPNELKDLQNTITAAMGEGNKTTVEAQVETGKEEATQ